MWPNGVWSLKQLSNSSSTTFSSFLLQGGNQFFKDGKYNDAVEGYTRGMSADPYNPILPTNQAACFFRLKKYAEAEEDCTKAIALDGTYTKAFARAALGRLSEAKEEATEENGDRRGWWRAHSFNGTTEIQWKLCKPGPVPTVSASLSERAAQELLTQIPWANKVLQKEEKVTSRMDQTSSTSSSSVQPEFLHLPQTAFSWSQT
ncbi:hypothetical protein SRHO_G00088510 [Serrasalmus rhombeus]